MCAAPTGALAIGGDKRVPSLEGGLRILIADDDPAFRELVRAMVEEQGHQALLAGSGPEALACFVGAQPDLVLMDVHLPGLDGFQAAQYVRELSGETLVPVIFVTGDRQADMVARCVESGGSDVLVKPISPDVLRAKIEGFARLRGLLQTVRHQRDEMTRHNRWMEREYQVAEGVFAKVMRSDALRAPNIRYLVSPLAVFNGDLLLGAHRPSGELHLLVGDFAGHGLSAAVGAIPVAEIFHGMTAKGFPLPEIVAEINEKLLSVLPRGLFLGAALMEVDAVGQTLSVWNGGLPDILVTAGDREPVVARVPSRAFPLGVVETAQLDCTPVTLPIAAGYHIYAHTDGLTETDNGRGERFGDGRLAACFGRRGDGLPTFDRILNDLQEFRGQGRQSDDVTLVQVVADPKLARRPGGREPDAGPGPRPPLNWSMSFLFGADALRAHDPLPGILQAILDAQRLHQHKQRIYMVLSELFLNALEHGLLGLDSAIKAGPNGFSEYYREKERRLQALSGGFIKVCLEHAAIGSGGRLVIRVEDSGPGFDHAQTLRHAQIPEAGYCGRGIPAVRALCASLTYHGAGNRAEAVYVWESKGVPAADT